jgi:hypothetical protein
MLLWNEVQKHFPADLQADIQYSFSSHGADFLRIFFYPVYTVGMTEDEKEYIKHMMIDFFESISQAATLTFDGPYITPKVERFFREHEGNFAWMASYHVMDRLNRQYEVRLFFENAMESGCEIKKVKKEITTYEANCKDTGEAIK